MNQTHEELIEGLENQIDPALVEVENSYDVKIVSSWIIGSRHQDLASETSDIDVVAVYMQNPTLSVRQNPTPKDRVTTIKIGNVEVKLISLTEFCRSVKNSSAQAFEILFYSTSYNSCFDYLKADLRELFLEHWDRFVTINYLKGLVHRNVMTYSDNRCKDKETPAKLLMIVAKYGLMAYLASSKELGFFKQRRPELDEIVKEDTCIPTVIKTIYEKYNTPEAYRGMLDLEGMALFSELHNCLETVLDIGITSSRIGWKDEDYKQLDLLTDRLVVRYYQDIIPDNDFY